MDHSAEFRRCLVECDVPAVRRLWAHVSPHLPQPKDDAEALVTLHYARTVADTMPLKARAWSHRWLLDHGYPSGLPDHLKPDAEKLYPKVVGVVGIAVHAVSGFCQGHALAIRGAMSDAVAEAYADGHTDCEYVKARMNEARDKFRAM